MAVINGTTGNDLVSTATSGNDSITTFAGNDTILGSGGNDVINAGEATSIVYWRSANFGDIDVVGYADLFSSVGQAESAVSIVADLALGTVRKFGAGGALLGTDTLSGVDGVFGTGSADRLSGRDLWDTETFQGYQGNDTIDGRGGYDVANYLDTELNTAGITVNLAAGTVTGDASIGSDTLREIEIVGGTNFADTYVATGFGGSSANRNSYGEGYNQFTGLAGADTVTGNGETLINFSGAGGAVSVNLGLQTGPGVAARVVLNAASGSFLNGYDPGNDLVAGVYGVRGTRFNDTLVGGGQVNELVIGETVSGDSSFERFRGDGGNDLIDGGSGLDRADYGTSSSTATGLTVDLAAGTVTGDANSVGTDTLRGVEGINSTAFDDSYSAVGFTLSNAVSASVNSGDAIATVAAGESLASLAYNEFRAFAGDDTVSGNGATRVSFAGMAVETLTGPDPSVLVSFNDASSGSAVYGQTDGGLGSVSFSGVYSIRGGVANDSVTGSAGFQAFEGYYGDDTLLGGDGNDLLYGHLRRTDDTELNLSTGLTDDDRLDGGAGDDGLYGQFGDDTLIGGAGNDTLIGGTGNDSLSGDDGDDAYYVDAVGDVVAEASGAGSDTVYATVTYTLAANVDNLALQGVAAVNGTGNGEANAITGNGAGNVLTGGLGADTLNGANGNDSLAGGGGGDLYIVNAVGDVVTEGVGAGTDTVNASLSWTLGANLEYLQLTGTGAIDGTGNALANKLTGNGAGNRLVGLDGNDVLNGGLGNDTLEGGTGDDTYTVNVAGDVVIETAGAGTDLVRSQLSWTLGATLENLTIVGTSAADGTGNATANRLVGNGAANRFEGGGGDDTLLGAGGADTLVGGAGNDSLSGALGADVFAFASALDAASNVDTISDFSRTVDRIHLDDAVFGAIGAPGALAAGAYRAGTVAGDADDRIVYDQASGHLFYDADGHGAAAQVLFAQLAPGTLLAATSFVVI